MNYCFDCIRVTSGVDRITNNGDIIWEKHSDTPKNYMDDLESLAFVEDREKLIVNRARDAQLFIKSQSKIRRDLNRRNKMRNRARDYQVKDGFYLSFGYDSKAFDEYFGEVNEKNEPHGNGVKVYSDGSVYYGEWMNGMRHTHGRGTWLRPDGSQYEGSWQEDQKHGNGMQTYPDGGTYVGEFAKGYEHGHGIKKYIDKSIFEGRFRFGRRDGPGVLQHVDGTIERRVFKEKDVFHEKPIPDVIEMETDSPDRVVFEPDSLLKLCSDKIATYMATEKKIFTPENVYQRLTNYMKVPIVEKYLSNIVPETSIMETFVEYTSRIAFKPVESVVYRGLKLTYEHMEIVLFLIAANSNLKHLEFSVCKLDNASINLVCAKLLANTWKQLESLDLSFNTFTITGVQNLGAGLENSPSVRKVKLSCCKINAAGGLVLAR